MNNHKRRKLNGQQNGSVTIKLEIKLMTILMALRQTQKRKDMKQMSVKTEISNKENEGLSVQINIQEK